MKRRFESSLARRLLPLSAAGVRAERAAGVRRGRGRQAMAEIRESGKPLDCLAFCAAIPRMLRQVENRNPLFAFSKKL